jgi:hypothetical protein
VRGAAAEKRQHLFGIQRQRAAYRARRRNVNISGIIERSKAWRDAGGAFGKSGLDLATALVRLLAAHHASVLSQRRSLSLFISCALAVASLL